ncbi:MAG: RagB/SusD family nutrient uptake outer membrane protein, partial [Bacteroidetes bacterium]|nr:RagB/SusD family nutrient uptake outer membrane protein [Bacteroidota bacterium]
LDVAVDSQYVGSNFPTTRADYASVIGPVYTQLSANYCTEYFRMQELSTDEAIIPGRDGNYDDGGQYRQHHHHTWTPDHTNVITVWGWGFGGINACNRIKSVFDASPLPATDPIKVSALAEVKAMRALFYYFMMDIYGNVPIIDTFPVATLPGLQPRTKVFQFIESELKAVLPSLPAKTAANATATYGHPTKGLAYAILEKMYLNAEVYTGTPRYNDAVAMADSILNSGSYSLDANFASVFAPDNGPQIQETIFAIPYDAALIGGQQFTRHGLHPLLCPKFGVPSNMSISMSTLPEFYARFTLAGDVRTNTWIIGKQYNFDGSPIYSKDIGQPMTTKALDQFYPGTDHDTLWQVEIYPQIKMLGLKPFDLGNDWHAKCEGIRSLKYYPDKNILASTRNGGNDVPVFRLADVILMKAEAIMRGATPTTVKSELQTPAVLVNKVRTRVNAQPLATTTFTLDSLLDERAREFYWECWRRNDLIRFGKFETEYPIPGDVAVPGYTPGMNKDLTRRIFPVPNTERKLNPNLGQNPGY